MKPVHIAAVALALIAPLASVQAQECPAVLTHPHVQSVAAKAGGSSGFGTGLLRVYQQFEALRRGPPLAEVRTALEQLGDEAAVRICFPQLQAGYLQSVAAAKVQAEKAEQRRATSAAEAEAVRKSNEARAAKFARQREDEAEQARKDVADRVEQGKQLQLQWEADRIAKEQEAIEAAKPRNQLMYAYLTYSVVRQCHEQRKGYLATYVNDVEVERARRAMTVIEKIILAREPSLPVAEMWEQASRKRVNFEFGFNEANKWGCERALVSITNAVPSAAPAKDF